MLPNLEKVEDSIQFDHTKVSIFYEDICSCSSMDRTLVSGTEDLGSTPSGSARSKIIKLILAKHVEI